MKKLINLLPLCLLTVGLLALPACANKEPSHGHILTGAVVGTKAGINQNIGTGMYDLGVQRVFTGFASIPIAWSTNKNGDLSVVVPDSAVSYEVQGGNYVFGKIGLTVTVATGTNGVNTLIGGQHLPINENITTTVVSAPTLPTPTVTAPTVAAPAKL